MTSSSVRAQGDRELAYADTNLFVALFGDSTHPLHERALGLFRRVAEGDLSLIVTAMVVAELVYVARSILGWSREQTATQLGSLLEADGLVVAEQAVLQRALALYREWARLDFADAYLAAAALESGPATVASFDTDFDLVAGVRRVSA